MSKLTYDDKINLYNDKKNGMSIGSLSNKYKVRKCVIPVAGMGTRFLPGTKSIPKEMFPIIDKPAIQYIVEEAVASGIEEIFFITSSYKNAIVDHVSWNNNREVVEEETDEK